MLSTYTDPQAYMEGSLLFSASHIVSLCVTIALLFFLFLFRNESWMKMNGRWLIVLGLAGSEIWLNYWYFTTGMWDIRYTLPFQLCSISLYLCVWMLLTRQKLVFEVVYFLGVGGALQALLTPELFYDFPHFRFLHFFIAHISIIMAVFYMLWIEKFQVKFKSVWKAFAALNVIAFIVYFVNKLTGGNYMFLAEKPTNASLIDFLGPYPWYILTLEFVVLFIFLLLYAPFFFQEKMKSRKKRRST
ncbi:TIGR02206 family membrane protein [Sutcliffiella horikoshii]|uniref:YwaF family protein n=1 Tax=Sutcliffiella horikoshii TaxID=79883 RepID=UPI002041639B|nr:TIGR02206 family membrane protein [Sutcliffiella horikoshii]MCM3616573.1 TIGR02206 family membrane protein [Sutcliffiella horikoshii]